MIERILNLLSNNSMTAKELTTLLGIGKSTISEWKHGKTKPSVDHIIGISQIFNVSTDYILTGKHNVNLLTQHEQEIFNILHRFPDEYSQIKFVGVVGYIADNMLNKIDTDTK